MPFFDTHAFCCMEAEPTNTTCILMLLQVYYSGINYLLLPAFRSWFSEYERYGAQVYE